MKNTMLGSTHGQISTSFIGTKSLISLALILPSVVWDVQVEYSQEKEVLYVSFMGKQFSGTSCRYNVSLWGPPPSQDSAHVLDSYLKDSILVKPTGQIMTVQFFHVKLHPLDFLKIEPVNSAKWGGSCNASLESVTHKSYQQYVGRLNSRQKRSTDCLNWNAAINLFPNVEEQSIIVLFQVLPPHEQCFEAYRLYLYRDVPSVCDGEAGIRVASKEINMHNGTVTFQNLTPGNYCLRVFPPCPECGILYTDVVSLLGTPHADMATAPTASPQKAESSWSYAALAIGAVVILVLIGIAVKVLHIRCISSSQTSSIVTQAGPLHEDANMVHSNLKVIILHTPDCELHKAVVLALARFLRECCHVEVILEVLPAVEALSSEWVARQLDCRCKESTEHDCSKKVIVVESEGAVKLHEISKRGKIFRPLRPTIFYRVFYNALAVLFNKLDRALTDYRHICVVRFPYTPDSAKLRYLVPGQRFSLPSHLVDLYKALHDIRCDSISYAKQLEMELLQQWMDNEASYAGLRDAIDEMSAFVSLNPIFLTDVLVEVAI